MTTTSTDRRIRRTEQAVFHAFRELVLSRPYDEIRVSDIVERAGVGRSTFYEHYRNKDEVLTHTITWLFETLADAAVGQADDERLAFVVDHFFEQRRMARAILRDRPLRLLTDRLGTLLKERVEDELVARAVAAAQMEILNSWLSGRVHTDRTQVMSALSGLAPAYSAEE